MVMMTIVVTELAETIGQLSGDKLWREMFWVRFFFLSQLTCLYKRAANVYNPSIVRLWFYILRSKQTSLGL